MLVIVGGSGCGKSTLLRLVAGLEAPSTGRILLDGRDITNLDPSKRDIAMVFQNYALYPHMSVFENMAYGLKLKGLAKAEIARRAVDPADARASELMLRWGYPSVLDRFRFHLSLTGALDAGEVVRSGPLLEDIARLLPAVPMRFDAVCLFEEAQPGHPLRLVERIGFRP